MFLAASASGAPVPREAAEHFASCPSCRSVIRGLQQGPAFAPLSTEEVQRIADLTLRDVKPVKRLMPEGLLVALLLAIACAAAWVGVTIMGLGGWNALHWAQRFAVFACVAIDIGLLAVSVSRQIVPGSRLVIAPGWLVAAAIASLAIVFGGLFRPIPEATFVATGLFCLKVGVAFAIPVGVLASSLLVRGAILNAVLTGLTAGALAGATALSVLELFCPNLNVNHKVVWHLGAVIVSSLLGLAVGAVADWLQSTRNRP
jgi:hypothetical protein